MRAARGAVIAAVALLGAVSCDDPLLPDMGVDIYATRDAVVIHNRHELFSVYTWVIDEDAARLTDPAPCPPACGEVPPKGTRRVTAAEAMSGPGETVLVFWATMTSGAGGSVQLGPMTNERVVLRRTPFP